MCKSSRESIQVGESVEPIIHVFQLELSAFVLGVLLVAGLTRRVL